MRTGKLVPALAAIATAVALTACGAENSSSASLTTAASAASPAVHRHATRPRRVRRRTQRAAPAARVALLPVSRASSTVVQPQPDPGSCHARGSGGFSEPDGSCTPGALNPAVTQATIGTTICMSGYTKTIRPPEHITAEEKLASMAAYGDSGSPSNFEYDHLVSLELGGAANDPRNLWPQPGASPNPKDAVENDLHRLVCSGQMPLARAQKIIAKAWIAYYKSHGFGSSTPAGSREPAPSSASTSSASTPSGSTAAPSTAAAQGPNKPISEINCSDFPTHAAAQRWFDQHGGSASNDVAGLDGDHDGRACESLP